MLTNNSSAMILRLGGGAFQKSLRSAAVFFDPLKKKTWFLIFCNNDLKIFINRSVKIIYLITLVIPVRDNFFYSCHQNQSYGWHFDRNRYGNIKLQNRKTHETNFQKKTGSLRSISMFLPKLTQNPVAKSFWEAEENKNKVTDTLIFWLYK